MTYTTQGYGDVATWGGRVPHFDQPDDDEWIGIEAERLAKPVLQELQAGGAARWDTLMWQLDTPEADLGGALMALWPLIMADHGQAAEKLKELIHQAALIEAAANLKALKARNHTRKAA